MTRTVLFLVFVTTFNLVASHFAIAQTIPTIGLPNFDDVVSIDAPVIVFRDSAAKTKYYVVPQTPAQSGRWDLSLLYSKNNSALIGNLVLDTPSLLSKATMDAVRMQLDKITPNPELVVAQPIYSEFRVRLFGQVETVTDRFVVNPVGDKVSLSFAADELVIRSLLHDTAYLTDLGVVTFKFEIKGVEIDNSFAPRVSRRWFNIHSVISGNCLKNPERFLNVESGITGCIFNIRAKRSEIVFVQGYLKRQGYYEGRVDGVIGLQTRNAIKAFQASEGIPPDGLLTGKLVDLLWAKDRAGHSKPN